MKDGKMEGRKDGKAPCQAMTADGSSCRAAALAGSDFCYFHDPSNAEERREAQAQGGRQNRMKTLAPDTPDVKLEDTGATVRLLSDTINQVRKGQIDPRVANAVGYLANILVKALEQGDMEKRIEGLEVLIKDRKTAMTGMN
jgi:hypothetical protein